MRAPARPVLALVPRPTGAIRIGLGIPTLPVVLGLVAALWGCGVQPEHSNASGPQALKGAEPAPEVEQVLAIVNFAGGQCSGSPIAPDLVLTARHCIGRTSEISRRVVCTKTMFTDPDSAGAMFVLTTPAITDEPDDYNAVREVRVLPGNDPSFCGQDVALLRLRKPLHVAPLIPRVDEPLVAGEAYTAYGFGDDEGEVGAGVRRKLTGLTVNCVGRECPDAEVFDTEWVGSDGVCSGDSGGPALDASGRLLGVVSRGYSDCRSPVYGSVPAFAQFLEAEALLAAEEGDYEAPAWARGFSTQPRFYQPVGASCEAPSDCPSGLCGPDRSCTRECSAVGPCPNGYRCDQASSSCVRDEEIPGEEDPNEGSKAPASSCAFGGPVRRTPGWLASVSIVALVGALSARPLRRTRGRPARTKTDAVRARGSKQLAAR